MPTRKDDEKLDQAVEDSFPASDPPAASGVVGPRRARTRRPPPAERAPAERDDEARAEGTPHERHGC